MTQAPTQQHNPQIFTIYSDEIKERLDPYFYSPIFIKTIAQIEKLNYQTVNLCKIADIFSGARPKGGVGQILEGIPSLGGEHILSTGEVKTENLKFIPQNFHNSHLESSVKLNDIILVKDGATTGKVGIIPENYPHKECNINEHVFAIRIKNINNAIPEYLFSFLISYFGQIQIKREITGATVTGLTRESVKNLQIPLPPLPTQTQIVSIMQKAYQEKKEKEAEANRLLESIDNYVLAELGIKMPEIKRDMFFEIWSDKVENSRMDPLYYSQKDIYGFLKGIKYKIYSVRDAIEYLQSGFAAGANNQEENGAIQIRPTNIDNYGHLKFDKNIFVKREYLEKRKNDILQKGEVLFNNTNSQELVGKTSFFDLDGSYFCSNHVTRIKTNKNLCPEFLKLILNIYQKIGIFYNICTNWNNQSGVNIELLKTVKIPAPPLAIQTKIAEKVKSYYSQAQKLKAEANNNLQTAKEKVEKIILE